MSNVVLLFAEMMREVKLSEDETVVSFDVMHSGQLHTHPESGDAMFMTSA